MIALYAAVFADKFAGLELVNLPASHREGPDFLNVLRILNVPQAAALAAERAPVQISTPDPKAWSYPTEVARALGWKNDRLRITASSDGKTQ